MQRLVQSELLSQSSGIVSMCGILQDSICSCKQLRMLYISTGLVQGLCGNTGDAVSTFCVQLPQLRTLQWRMATSGPERPNHFSPAFVAKVATHVTPGLRLLQVLSQLPPPCHRMCPRTAPQQ